jgi:hypothetical protein
MLWWLVKELQPQALVVDSLLSLCHSIPLRIMFKVLRMVGVQDNKTNHVIETATDLRIWDLQTVIVGDLVLGLLPVDGMLVIPLRLVAISSMREILQTEIVGPMIVAGPAAETNIASVALLVEAVAQAHQDMEAQTNGLVMITQLGKITSKVYAPPSLHFEPCWQSAVLSRTLFVGGVT